MFFTSEKFLVSIFKFAAAQERRSFCCRERFPGLAANGTGAIEHRIQYPAGQR